MEHDLVIITSSNMTYAPDNCFSISVGSNCFCVGDKIAWTAGNQKGSVGVVVANPTNGNYLICKEEEDA